MPLDDTRVRGEPVIALPVTVTLLIGYEYPTTVAVMVITWPGPTGFGLAETGNRRSAGYDG